MAKESFKLYYEPNIAEGFENHIRQFCKERNIKVMKVNRGDSPLVRWIRFQRKEDLEAALRLQTIHLGEGAKITLKEHDPAALERGSSLMPQSVRTEAPVTAHDFLNPYHFVDVREYTARYPYLPHDTFQHHTGRVFVELEFIRPAFIPDSENVYYITFG